MFVSNANVYCPYVDGDLVFLKFGFHFSTGILWPCYGWWDFLYLRRVGYSTNVYFFLRSLKKLLGKELKTTKPGSLGIGLRDDNAACKVRLATPYVLGHCDLYKHDFHIIPQSPFPFPHVVCWWIFSNIAASIRPLHLFSLTLFRPAYNILRTRTIFRQSSLNSPT